MVVVMDLHCIHFSFLISHFSFLISHFSFIIHHSSFIIYYSNHCYHQSSNLPFLYFLTNRVMVLYDNEEVGSRSLMGADSTLLGDVYQAVSPNEEFQRMARQKSLLLSCVGIPSFHLSHNHHSLHCTLSIIHRIWHTPFTPILRVSTSLTTSLR